VLSGGVVAVGVDGAAGPQVPLGQPVAAVVPLGDGAGGPYGRVRALRGAGGEQVGQVAVGVVRELANPTQRVLGAGQPPGRVIGVAADVAQRINPRDQVAGVVVAVRGDLVCLRSVRPLDRDQPVVCVVGVGGRVRVGICALDHVVVEVIGRRGRVAQ